MIDRKFAYDERQLADAMEAQWGCRQDAFPIAASRVGCGVIDIHQAMDGDGEPAVVKSLLNILRVPYATIGWGEDE